MKKVIISGQQCCKECRRPVDDPKEHWFHWFIEHCPKCDSGVSQMPIRDDIGEDCCLFGKVDEYKSHQKGDKPYLCSCGTALQPRYRYALADRNCLTIDGEPVKCAPLLPNQSEGTFMAESEYDKLAEAIKLSPVAS